MHVRAKTGTAGVLLAFVSFIQPAPGEVTYLSQIRNVGGIGWDTFPSTFPPGWYWVPAKGQIDAPNFGPFADEWNHGASAKQNSVLGTTTISASGEAFAEDLYYKSKLTDGSSFCTFGVSFSLDEPTPFDLSGSLSAKNATGFGCSVKFMLSGEGLSYDYSNSGPNGGTFVPFNHQGVLPPGIYTLSATTNAYGDALEAFGASFNFNLAIPAPGSMAGVMACGLLAARRRR